MPKNKPTHRTSNRVSNRTSNRVSNRTSNQMADPHQAREAENYENPIASREHLLHLIETHFQGAAGLGELAAFLNLDRTQTFALKKRLRAMVRDGQAVSLAKGRYAKVAHSQPDDALFSARVFVHKSGQMQVVAETQNAEPRNDRAAEYRVLPADQRWLMAGDVVEVSIIAHSGGSAQKNSGKRGGKSARSGTDTVRVHKVIKRHFARLAGTVMASNTGYRFVPHGPSMPDFFIAHDVDENAHVDGDTPDTGEALAEIIAFPTSAQLGTVRIVEHLSDNLAASIRWAAILRGDIPYEFRADAMIEADKKAANYRKAYEEGTNTDPTRTDLQHLPFCTIDGATAKDFDDAICVTREGAGFRLWVAIADVAHFVEEGSSLDNIARERGTSVYFPDGVVPMLPEVLSNDICSLRPNVPRFVLVCDMALDGEGAVQSHRFYNGVICSAARLTYDAVNDHWQTGAALDIADDTTADNRTDAVAESVTESLAALHDLCTVQLAARARRGALRIDVADPQITLNERGLPHEISISARGRAEMAIEECMLAANVSAAMFLAKAEAAFLWRTHPAPEADKWEAIARTLVACQLPALTEHSAWALNAVLDSALDAKPHTTSAAKSAATTDGARTAPNPLTQTLSSLILRSLPQARYDVHNLGHFGLNYPHYTHFTSPIRRYPDLVNHRAIKAVLAGSTTHNTHLVAPLGVACSAYEQRANTAVRWVEGALKCHYAAGHLGEVFMGTVSRITAIGAFVLLDDVLIEGLVHISQLGDAYYYFDADRYVLYAERGRGSGAGDTIRMGDRFMVRIDRVDTARLRVDFERIDSADNA